jgi:hypothetical protein
MAYATVILGHLNPLVPRASSLRKRRRVVAIFAVEGTLITMLLCQKLLLKMNHIFGAALCKADWERWAWAI